MKLIKVEYEKIEKGIMGEFESIDWLDNEFFDGDFLDFYQFGFSPVVSNWSLELSE